MTPPRKAPLVDPVDIMAIDAWLARYDADPLGGFAWASDAQRQTAEYWAQGLEVHHRAANKAGKTLGFAAVVVAALRGDRELAGVKLPRFERPPIGALLVRTYDQQVESSQAAILRWLGTWPHEKVWMNRGRGILHALRVRPRDWKDDDPATWSRISFHSQADSQPEAIQGQRWDFVWGDEPPKEAFWREARKNARYRAITETPVFAGDWEWVREDFDGTLNNPMGGRIEVTSTLYDNQFLTDQEKAALVASYKGDPAADARIMGHYVDLTGKSPWSNEGQIRLQQMLKRCQPGEATPITLPGWDTPINVQRWYNVEPGGHYILSADLAEGIDDKRHDPLHFDLGHRETAFHVARYHGWDDPYQVGLLSAHMADGYNGAYVDFDATGGYGQAYQRGLLDYRSRDWPRGYTNVVPRMAADKPADEPGERWGYKVSGGSRAEIMSILREWLTADPAKAGKLLRTWDRTAVESLLRIRMERTPSGLMRIARSKTGGGTGPDHAEAMWCLGRFVLLNDLLPWPRQERVQQENVRALVKTLTGGRDLLPKDYGRTRTAAQVPDRWR